MVIACGGFESSAEMRTRYLGPGWELAKVRGTPYNTGDGINMALAIGASSFGNWSGSHAVQWDYNAPEFGDLSVGDNFQKHSYPWGILINATGRRFVDEGADFRNYTYAKYGAVVLRQPNNFAWQVFDGRSSRCCATSTASSACQQGLAPTPSRSSRTSSKASTRSAFLDEIKKYNAAVKKDVKFNPNIKDGRCTVGLDVNKSNWANTIEEPPFEGYQVGCGVSFTLRRRAHRSRHRPGDRRRHEPDPGPLRRGRTGRRHLLLQLSGRLRPDVGRRVRPHRRRRRRRARGMRELTQVAHCKRQCAPHLPRVDAERCSGERCRGCGAQFCTTKAGSRPGSHRSAVAPRRCAAGAVTSRRDWSTSLT